LLESDLEEQLNRKKIVEDKAKAILGTISITITAITFALINQKVFSDPFSIIEVGLLLISVISFIMAIIRSIQSMNIRNYYLKQGIIDLVKDDRIVVAIEVDLRKKFEDLLYYKMANNNTILQNSNYAFAAFILVRNGLLSFTMFFIVSLIGKAMGNC
jgi:hypothetical protein